MCLVFTYLLFFQLLTFFDYLGFTFYDFSCIMHIVVFLSYRCLFLRLSFPSIATLCVSVCPCVYSYVWSPCFLAPCRCFMDSLSLFIHKYEYTISIFSLEVSCRPYHVLCGKRIHSSRRQYPALKQQCVKIHF